LKADGLTYGTDFWGKYVGGKEVRQKFYQRTRNCPDGGLLDPKNYKVFPIFGPDSCFGDKLQGCSVRQSHGDVFMKKEWFT